MEDCEHGINLKAKGIKTCIGMEHPNVAKAPPWVWWTGGPPMSEQKYSIQVAKEEPVYEQWNCSPTLTRTHEVKNRIGQIRNQGIWDDYKKITNPYEYIFLSLNRRMSRSVASRIPLSRSYFKMLELWVGAGLGQEIEQILKGKQLITSHAAEGPGGFIEAIHDSMPGRVQYTQAITLRSTSKSIPGWRKTSAFLNKHPEINITYGADDTGDLLKIENLDNYVERFGANKAHIYTADGGFDFSSDFNAQEETILPLLTAEFYVGMKSIQRGGIILVKIFDTILRPTLELLWLTTRSFREWTILKPRTSRGGNAERYLICKGFLGLSAEDDTFFRQAIECSARGEIIQSFLETKPDRAWLQTMLMLQEAIAYQEAEIILNTLNLIEKPNEKEIRQYIEHNVERSIQWCIEHKEATNQKWQDPEWRLRTINEEIKELTGVNSISWRGVDSSQSDQQEPFPRPQRRRAATFARSQSSHTEKATSRVRRAGSPDAEGWQKV